MAKRKAAGSTRKAARKSSRRGARPSGRKTARKAAKAARKSSARAAGARSSARSTRKTAAKSTAKRKTVRKVAKRAAPRAAAKPAKKAARQSPVSKPRSAPPARTRARSAAAVAPKKVPALDRARRTITDEEDDLVPTPPSSLDLDRSASAIRTGRRGMQKSFHEHTETSPAMTGGDVDADWESAYSVGDEAPGGDNPTPDQDIVDDIGRAVGVEYQDNEELKGEEKIAKRDAHRWELDPASSEDWDDRD
jgi:hypothetical protein